MRYFKLFCTLTFCLLFSSRLFSEISLNMDRKELVTRFEILIKKHKELGEEVRFLQELLGIFSPLEKLELAAIKEDMTASLKAKFKKAAQAYQDGDYSLAKNIFQQAWEENPNIYQTNYNLGLTYQKLGQLPIAKRMLKNALEMYPQIEGASSIQRFLSGQEWELNIKDGTLSTEEELNTEIINLKKEMESYVSSKILSQPKRFELAVGVLEEIEKKIRESKELKQKYFLELADHYEAFAWYEKALNITRAYEKSMEGKVLPDGYYTRLLQLEEKYKKQKKVLQGYLDSPEDTLKRALKRELEEISIFASQFDEFVKEFNDLDEDFVKIRGRLKEFRWANESDRHVVVFNRYKQLLYSNLAGTRPLDHYQDKSGELFFKNITLLSAKIKGQKAYCKVLDLLVGKDYVPYLLLYSYIPKHESFIVVRIPKADVL